VFFARWPGTYVEDRLRNDWLLELGKRRDWPRLRAELPLYRMNDDRDVACYALLLQHQDGQDVAGAARTQWLAAQRSLDDGCALLGQTLVEARVLSPADTWQALRTAVEANRARAARTAAPLLGPAVERAVLDLLEKPAAYLARPAGKRAAVDSASAAELDLLALMRWAAGAPEAAAAWLDTNGTTLGAAHSATAWAFVAKQAAFKQLPEAADHARRAWQRAAAAKTPASPSWSDDLLAWHVRAALRESGNRAPRWQLVHSAINQMTAAEQTDPAWTYWKARANQALAGAGAPGDAARAAARSTLGDLAGQAHFYGRLAASDLGLPAATPPAAAPLTPEERATPRSQPGFLRALLLIQIGLRNEGVREWNYMLRGLTDRQLLAAAQLACDREVWDRCINTSERTRSSFDVQQRFPTPYRAQVLAQARASGLDPAVVFGLVRQESRFQVDAKSSVGASGLMQLMPATARWTAKKVGIDFKPQQITDPDVNLQLGSAYLKRLLDDFDGSLVMAAAAYNAGPGRPRRWREGAVLEPAAWVESIPFTETRDYVKKVLTNAVDYASVLGQPVPALKAKLGPQIGPRDPAAAVDRDLP
jgi:soluble lytic murein transglycosylase